MLAFLARMSPLRAIQDLRLFLSRRRPVELVFLLIAFMLTTLVIVGFVIDSRFERPYKRDIVYFESWPVTRSSEQIRAAQARDMAVRTKRDVTYEKRQADLKAQFKRLDDKLTKWGI